MPETDTTGTTLKTWEAAVQGQTRTWMSTRMMMEKHAGRIASATARLHQACLATKANVNVNVNTNGGDSSRHGERFDGSTESTAPRSRAALCLGLLGAVAGLLALPSCTAGTGGPLRPAWQQDATLQHHGVPSYSAQSATTPHLVARVIYAAPEDLPYLIQRQGDVADATHGPARMGDGTFDLAVQDAVTGKWLESYVCGGNLFVAGLPNQAYRLVVKNRTPLPLELGVGVDGRDVQTGAVASYRRGTLRVEPKGTLVVGTAAHGGPLLFRPVHGDAAVHEMGPRGRNGLIQIAAYLASDAPSLGSEKLRASQLAPLGLLPLATPPEQYR